MSRNEPSIVSLLAAVFLPLAVNIAFWWFYCWYGEWDIVKTAFDLLAFAVAFCWTGVVFFWLFGSLFIED